MQYDYRKRYKRAFKRNCDRVLKELRQGELEEKIERFSILHGFTPKEIRNCFEPFSSLLRMGIIMNCWIRK